MKAKRKQSAGLTLAEAMTAMAIIAMLLGLAIPSIRAINSSFQSTGAKNIISGALAYARATAAQHQRYAGIRFQFDQYGNQYIIPIIQDPSIMKYGFRAIEGRKPIKLPENRGVMDFIIVTKRNAVNPVNPEQVRLDSPSVTDVEKDNWLSPAGPNANAALTDITTFALIFSPSGKLVIHGVRIRNKDGETDNSSDDDVFNTFDNVNNDDPNGMFYQDDYFDNDYFVPANLALGPEPSRSSFVIYDKKKFDSIDPAFRWSDYLQHLKVVYINPYTGTIIE